MGKLANGPFELRLAATLFLLLLAVADIFGAWQVKNFAAFSPARVAREVAPSGADQLQPPGTGANGEHAIDLAALDRQPHHIARELLVQDTHVHVPAYALTAAALSLIVLGLELASGLRSLLIAAAFAAPVLDFGGLWGAQLQPSAGVVWGTVAVAGGVLMGLVFLVILFLTMTQCWLRRAGKEVEHE